MVHKLCTHKTKTFFKSNHLFNQSPGPKVGDLRRTDSALGIFLGRNACNQHNTKQGAGKKQVSCSHLIPLKTRDGRD